MGFSPPRILVHEYVTGGGWPAPDLPRGLAAEGLAMLRAVLHDFQSWGSGCLTTTRDVRLAELSLDAEKIATINHNEYLEIFEDLVSEADAVLLIAPESDGILSRLSALVEENGKLLLGSSSEASRVAGDKWDCFLRFHEDNLPTPRTRLVSCTEAFAKAREFGFPLVVKPVDGVGCEGVSQIPGLSSLQTALDLLHPQTQRILVQQYLSGTHASVSLLVAQNRALPLSLNRQAVCAGMPFLYQGGAVPLDHALRDAAFEYAKRAVSLIPGLGGYVGVDMLLTENECYTIEINPRLTTSYVGLRRIININLAEAIWRACEDGALPREIVLSGSTSFNKDGEEVNAAGPD